MKYQISIDNQTFDLSDQQIETLDIARNKDGFHVLQDQQAYHIKVISTDFVNKRMTLEVNGNKHQLTIKDEYDLLVKKMGLSAITSQKMSQVKAPMPGLILDILVEAGQAIEKGTQLVILEAMKMENILKADGEGVIKSIEIKQGVAVEKGQVLIEME